MTVNELMVNDWMYSTFAEYPCKVEGIEWVESGYAFVNISGVDGYKCIESLSPIPLTAEILEKNEFVPNTHVYPYPYYEYINKEDKLKIGFAFPKGNKTSYKEPWVYIDSENVFIEHLPCIFVHQLQQIFRLCGMNGMANNFKV